MNAFGYQGHSSREGEPPGEPLSAVARTEPWPPRIAKTRQSMTRTRLTCIVGAITAILLAGLAFEIVTTQPVRGAMRTCSELFTIANRPDLTDAERLAAARSLCTARYLRAHPLAVAPEGGIIGIPRNINMNFKAWREGPDVWICPTEPDRARLSVRLRRRPLAF